jgi:hypothetical protein
MLVFGQKRFLGIDSEPACGPDEVNNSKHEQVKSITIELSLGKFVPNQV